MNRLKNSNQPENNLPVSHAIALGLLTLFIILLIVSITFHSPFGIVSTDLTYTYLSLLVSIISLIVCPKNVVLNLYSFFFHLLFTQNLIFFFIYPNFDVLLPDYIGDFQINSEGLKRTTLILLLLNIIISASLKSLDFELRNYLRLAKASKIFNSNNFLSKVIVLLALTSFLSLTWGILTVKTGLISVSPGGSPVAIFFNLIIVNYLSFKPLLLMFFSTTLTLNIKNISNINKFLIISSFIFLLAGRMYFGSKSSLAIFIFYFFICYMSVNTVIRGLRKKITILISIIPFFYASYVGGEVFRVWKATPEINKIEFLLNHSYLRGSVPTILSRISSRVSTFHYFYIISNHRSELSEKISIAEGALTFLSQVSNINIYNQLPSSLIMRSYLYPNYPYDKNFKSYQTDWYSLPGELFLKTKNTFITIIFSALTLYILVKCYITFVPATAVSISLLQFLFFNILGSFGFSDSIPFLLKFVISLIFYLFILDLRLVKESEAKA